MRLLQSILAVFAAVGLTFSVNAADSAQKTRVLIVTGGHEYEKDAFFKLFQDNHDITFKSVEHPKAHEMFKPEHAGEYDVVLFYDMWQEITPEAQKDFTTLIQNGKGLVAMHHCLGSYQKWPEYEKMVGGKYHLDRWTDNGVEKPSSTYQHDVDFTVKVSAAAHPVTRGLSDFKIHDETYGRTTTTAEITPLLTTDEPTSGSIIGWAKTYGKGRVVGFALGHDHVAFENPNLQRFIAQAIQWTAGK